MAKAAGGFNKTTAKKIMTNLEADIADGKQRLNAIINDINELMTGKDGVAYWSGQHAYAWFQDALLQYDHDTELINHNEACKDYLAILVKKGRSL